MEAVAIGICFRRSSFNKRFIIHAIDWDMAKALDQLCDALEWLTLSSETKCINTAMRGELHFTSIKNELKSAFFVRISNAVANISQRHEWNRRKDNRARVRHSIAQRRLQANPDEKVPAPIPVESLLRPTPLDHKTVHIRLLRVWRHNDDVLKCKWVAAGAQSTEEAMQVVRESVVKLARRLDCDIKIVDPSVANLMYFLDCAALLDIPALRKNPWASYDKSDPFGSTTIQVKIERNAAIHSAVFAKAVLFRFGKIFLSGCKTVAEAENARRTLKAMLAPYIVSAGKSASKDKQ